MPLPGEAETILPTAGQLRDEALLVKICRVHKAGYVVYGARRVRLQLNREGIPVACCTVERLMVAAGLVHHWDRGVQYASITLSERFTETGIAAFVGAVGSCWDNALAETINGLCKTELIKPCKPWRSVDDVEFATADWVDWYNHRRLCQYCGDMSPVDLETRQRGHLHDLRPDQLRGRPRHLPPGHRLHGELVRRFAPLHRCVVRAPPFQGLIPIQGYSYRLASDDQTVTSHLHLGLLQGALSGTAQRMTVRQREHAAVRGAADALAGHLVHGAHLVRAVLAESMESTLRGLGHDVGAVGEDDAPADGDIGNINLGAGRQRVRQTFEKTHDLSDSSAWVK